MNIKAHDQQTQTSANSLKRRKKNNFLGIGYCYSWVQENSPASAFQVVKAIGAYHHSIFENILLILLNHIEGIYFKRLHINDKQNFNTFQRIKIKQAPSLDKKKIKE